MLADAVLGLREYVSGLSRNADGKRTDFVLSGSFIVLHETDETTETTITYRGRVSVKRNVLYSIAAPSQYPDLLPKVRDYLAGNGGYEVEPTDSFMDPVRFNVQVTGNRSEIMREEATVKQIFRGQLIATIYTV